MFNGDRSVQITSGLEKTESTFRRQSERDVDLMKMRGQTKAMHQELSRVDKEILRDPLFDL
jgi:hypothetical protein